MKIIFCLLPITLLLLHLHSHTTFASNSHLEGFDHEDDLLPDEHTPNSVKLTDLTQPPPPTPLDPNPLPLYPPQPETPFDYWDEDEFEGIPIIQQQSTSTPKPPLEDPEFTKNATESISESQSHINGNHNVVLKNKKSPSLEILSVTFLILFLINYFTGKRDNEKLALSWATMFATKGSIFDKNFSLLGVADNDDDSPLLLKEGGNVFKFYATGRRYCCGLFATIQLKNRQDLISRFYNFLVSAKDEITFQVYMNDDSMDHVVFALAKKKLAKVMHKEVRDLQKFAGLLSPPTGRKWVTDELVVISESKEVAGDFITEAVLDQVFGDKAFEKFGKDFISMHFTDQHPGTHKKMLFFKFALPSANNMADMTRLVALVPYYIDLIGRYKLSSQARSKAETARVKAAQEAHRELLNARQEALHRRKADRRKMIEEAEAKLSAEALRKKEAKERARQSKKAMPKIKMTRARSKEERILQWNLIFCDDLGEETE
ncbi:hypothetical protein ACFE04_003344 [Oxalis oulophora]